MQVQWKCVKQSITHNSSHFVSHSHAEPFCWKEEFIHSHAGRDKKDIASSLLKTWTRTDTHKSLTHTQHELEAWMWNILGSGYCVPVCGPKDWTSVSPLSFCVPPQGLSRVCTAGFRLQGLHANAAPPSRPATWAVIK